MAQTTHQSGPRPNQRGLGWALLVLFITVSVLCIIMIWGDNLSGEENDMPSYYRDTFVIDDSVYATVTAEAAAAEQAMTPTSAP